MLNGERKIARPLRWAMVGGGRTANVGYKHRLGALRDNTAYLLVAGAFDIDPARVLGEITSLVAVLGEYFPRNPHLPLTGCSHQSPREVRLEVHLVSLSSLVIGTLNRITVGQFTSTGAFSCAQFWRTLKERNQASSGPWPHQPR